MSTFQLRKTRDFGQIITDTFTYLRVHFKSLGKALFIFVFPILLISGVLISSSFVSMFDFADVTSNHPLNPEAAQMQLRYEAKY